MKKTFFLISAILAISGISTAAIEVMPGQPTVIDDNVTENVQSGSPLDVEKNGSRILVDPPVDYPPGDLRQVVQLENSSKEYNLTIQEYANWTVEPVSVRNSLNLSSSGQFQALNLSMKGNTDTSLDISTEGKVFEYVEVPSSVSLVQGIQRDLFFSYQIRKGVSPGSYTGNLSFSGMNQSETVDVNLTFVDNIDPELRNISTPDYQATQPKPMEVYVEDNREVESVTASVTELVTVNGSQRNRTFQDYRFEKVNNTDRWTIETDIREPGEYFVEIVATDNSGNRDNLTKGFEVSELDVVNLDNEGTVELPTFRTGNMVEKDIGDIENDTEVTFSLDRFNPDPSQVDLSILSDEEGPVYFEEVGQERTFSQAANLTLRIQGDRAVDYNGAFEVEGVRQHVDIEDLRFSGEFKDCTVPQNDRFKVLQRNVSLSAVNSTDCGESGWQLSYFIPSTAVESNAQLQEDVNLMVPRQLMNRQDLFREEILADQKAETKKWQYFSLGLSAGILSLGYLVWFMVRKAPYLYHVNLSPISKMQLRRLRKKLGIGGREDV